MRRLRPENGNERVRTAFLIFPKTINGTQRWFERASWVEVGVYGGPDVGYFWYATEWSS